jgi:hypothetical protein
VGSDGVHIVEDGTAVEHRIGEGHATPGRRGRRYVMDDDCISFEEESVGDCRSDVPDPTHDDRQRSRVHASSVGASGKPRISTALNLGTLALPRTGSARTTGFRRSSVGSPLEGLGHRAEDTPTPDPGLASQKRPHLLQELGEGRLSLEKQVVAARQGYKPGARDAGRNAATGLERDARLVARVHHQRRHAHL